MSNYHMTRLPKRASERFQRQSEGEGSDAHTEEGSAGSRSNWWCSQSCECVGTVMGRRWQGLGREAKKGCFWEQVPSSQITLSKPPPVADRDEPKGLWYACGLSKVSEEQARGSRRGDPLKGKPELWAGNDISLPSKDTEACLQIHQAGKNAHTLRHLHTWSPVGGSVWGDLGSLALVQEVHHWRWALMLKFTMFSVHFLCFVLTVPATTPVSCCHTVSACHYGL